MFLSTFRRSICATWFQCTQFTFYENDLTNSLVKLSIRKILFIKIPLWFYWTYVSTCSHACIFYVIHMMCMICCMTNESRKLIGIYWIFQNLGKVHTHRDMHAREITLPTAASFRRLFHVWLIRLSVGFSCCLGFSNSSCIFRRRIVLK